MIKLLKTKGNIHSGNCNLHLLWPILYDEVISVFNLLEFSIETPVSKVWFSHEIGEEHFVCS